MRLPNKTISSHLYRSACQTQNHFPLLRSLSSRPNQYQRQPNQTIYFHMKQDRLPNHELEKTYCLLRQNLLQYLTYSGSPDMYVIIHVNIHHAKPNISHISIWFGLFLRVCTNAAFRYLAIVLRMRRPLQYIVIDEKSF
jgi:hypothetical protein